MEQLEMRARTALGKPDQIPKVDWLPARNPLLCHPELREAVQNGRLVRHQIDSQEIRRLFHDLESFLDLPPEA